MFNTKLRYYCMASKRTDITLKYSIQLIHLKKDVTSKHQILNQEKTLKLF